MELLTSCNAPINCLIILGAVIATIVVVFCIKYGDSESETTRDFCVVVGIFGMCLFIVCMVVGFKGVPSRQVSTIEITDQRAYEWLIENDYTINKRVYDNKNIYEVTGAPIPDEWYTDW